MPNYLGPGSTTFFSQSTLVKPMQITIFQTHPSYLFRIDSTCSPFRKKAKLKIEMGTMNPFQEIYIKRSHGDLKKHQNKS